MSFRKPLKRRRKVTDQDARNVKRKTFEKKLTKEIAACDLIEPVSYDQTVTFASPNKINDNDFSIGLSSVRKLQDRIRKCKGFEHCDTCNEPLRVIPTESRLVCTNCATSKEHALASSNTAVYGNNSHFPTHVYSRHKNYLDFLQQFVENRKPIPPEVMLRIKKAYRKLHAKSTLRVKRTPIRVLLKKLDLGEYVNDTAKIAALMNGDPIQVFTVEEVKIFDKMYRAYEETFAKIKNSGTTGRNYLSAPYVTSKFARARGKNHFDQSATTTKTRSVLTERDKAWKPVCEAIGFEFHRSI